MTTLPFSPEQEIKKLIGRCEWASLRYLKETSTYRQVRNDLPEKNESMTDEGLMVEVLANGHFGHSATADLSSDGIARAFEKAMQTTQITSQVKAFSFKSDDRPPVRGKFESPRTKKLDSISVAEITDHLTAATKAMASSPLVVNRLAQATLIETDSFYFSTTGSDIHQNFNLIAIDFSATAAEGSENQTRSWSQTGQWGAEIFDRTRFVSEATRIGKESVALLKAENCPTGKMDLLLMPDQMMLQIHESIGHPLELDRILGDERNYAGWSFVQKEDFGKLQYGSKLMNISFDPQQAHEFASYEFDDSGIPAKKEFLIKAGVLQRGLGSQESQRRSGLPGVANSRATSWNRAPIDRMANINLEPGESTLEEMIAQVKHGILMRTNRSWSIDDYRNKFQFGCEMGELIENGKIVKIVRNPNYRAITVDFWNRLAAVGNLGTTGTYGTPYCGKGEPNQIIRVGHRSPACLFRDIEVFGG